MNSLRFPNYPFHLCLLIGILAVGDVFAATITNAVPNAPNELLRKDSDLMATTIKMFGAFAIVLAVFGGFVLAVKKWGHLAPQANANRELNVVEFRVLAHKTYLYVIEHQQNRCVISVGPNGTTLISPATPPSFAANLPFSAEELVVERQATNS